MRRISFADLKQRLQTEEVNLVEVFSLEGVHDTREETDVNVPLETAGQQALEQFGKDEPIVVYGSQEQTLSCEKFAHRLGQLGFRQVFVYTGSKKEWDELGFPPR